MSKQSASKHAVTWLVTAAAISMAGPSAAAIVSDFATDTDGWLLFGDATTTVPGFVTSGGSPGGYIHGNDQTVGGLWQWQAPAKFLGDRTSSFGQLFTFDMRMRGSGPLFELPDVTLIGAGFTLYADLSPVQQNVPWTSDSVRLSEEGGWKVFHRKTTEIFDRAKRAYEHWYAGEVTADHDTEDWRRPGAYSSSSLSC